MRRLALKEKLFGWWYLCIGAGFTLLAIQHWMLGGVAWLIVLRFVIAAGFYLLGYWQLTGRLRKR